MGSIKTFDLPPEYLIDGKIPEHLLNGNLYERNVLFDLTFVVMVEDGFQFTGIDNMNKFKILDNA